MAQQTINVGTAPNDGTGTPLRTAFQYTNSNFSELYTAVGPSGNNIVVPGNATITGDLTVDTSTLKVDSANNRVGIGTASPSKPLEVYNTTESTVWANTTTGIALLRAGGTGGDFYFGIDNSTGGGFGQGNYSRLIYSTGAYPIVFSSNASERYRIASDGVATWSNVGGVAGTAMTLNSTGLGVGASPSHRLTVSGTAATNTTGLGLIGTTTGYNRVLINNTSGGGQFGVEGSSGGNLCVGSTAYSTVVGSYQNYSLHFITNNNVQATIDSSGNVGIGVTPSGKLEVQESGTGGGFGGIIASTATAGGNAGYVFRTGGTNRWAINLLGSAGAESLRFYDINNSAARMTLDASGRLLVGSTSTLIAADVRLHVEGSQGIVAKSTGGFAYYPFVAWNTATSGDNVFSAFGTEATYTARGSISYNRAGGLVAYNTTSDYRAKDIIGPVSNSGSLIDSLKVYVGKMKGATIERPMLIAHEAQEVAPYAVTGTKDEVDADGKPKYQQMDASALVPLLIAEIQSLRTRVQTLETR